MKRIFTLCTLHLAICTILWALPPKPEVLDSLLQVGDTARYQEMVQHSQEIQQRVAAVQARRVSGQVQTAKELNIAPRGLIILVNFSDTAFITPVDTIENMLNGEHFTRRFQLSGKTVTANGSARQYFIDQSWGQYHPQFDVVGPYTLSKEQSYYGENTSTRKDIHADEMIIEACKLANEDVDFTLYDNNNDGDIDFVYVIYAGEGEADGGPSYTTWPHTYWIKDGYWKYIKLDGKYLNTYACGNELMHGTRNYTGIGTFCHEFSHVLGLPDLYSTGGNTQYNTKLLGEWDILDAGCYNNNSNTPAAYSAYERFFMGWLTPTQISGDENIILYPLATGQGAALIAASLHNLTGNDPSPTTFYMLETRKKEGWDKYLPGEGMLLTKIQYNYDKWFRNTVNNTASKLGVDIIEADGKATYADYLGKEQDAFPRGAKYYKAITDHLITNIAWNSTVSKRYIQFTLNNGGETIEIGQLPTGIENINDNTNVNQAVKHIENGQIVIIRGNKKYTILGN